jgi:iron complex transport system substrate-binding protein
MLLDRRSVCMLLGALAAAPVSAVAAAAEPSVVVDVVGRKVAVRRPVKRIVLLDARDVVSMAVLHPDPSSLVVGWAGADTFDSDVLRRRYEVRAGGDAIPSVGGQTAETLSLERILSLEPHLVVATAHMEPALGGGLLTRRLEEAGIPVVFGNAASNRAPGDGSVTDPIADMAQSLRMWGAILDRRDRAEAFIAFVRDRLAAVAARLQGTVPTRAYLEVQSTYDDCCWAAGRHIWGDLLRRAGGRTLSVVDAPWYAKVAPEQLMVEAPDVYIASGGAFGEGIRPAIGPGLDAEAARAGLRRLTERTGLQTLPAVRKDRVHGVWTGLLTIPPLNVLFVEVAATWLHPAAFADLDPADTLAEINRRFLTDPLPGPCWVSLLS